MLTLTLPSFASCSGTDKKENESESSTAIESGTVTGSEHLSPENENNTAAGSETPDKSDAPTEKGSQAPAEESTQAPADVPTESESDPEPEPEPEPEHSLEYISNGNGTCSVSGIGDYKDAYVIIPEKSPSGDVVTAIEDSAFFENPNIIAVQIPSTVMSIGKMAFGGCPALVYVSVDTKNKVYTDINGVLFSKDKTRLILFPSANQTTELSISASVTEIADMAFFSTPYLKYIKYGGALSDWNKIKIGEKNYGIYSASLSFAVNE